jgi:hypothetical protein
MSTDPLDKAAELKKAAEVKHLFEGELATLQSEGKEVDPSVLHVVIERAYCQGWDDGYTCASAEYSSPAP